MQSRPLPMAFMDYYYISPYSVVKIDLEEYCAITVSKTINWLKLGLNLKALGVMNRCVAVLLFFFFRKYHWQLYV